MTLSHMLLSTQMDGEEVAQHPHFHGWDPEALAPLVAGDRSLENVSGYLLLRWLISGLSVFTLPAAGSQAWCPFPLPPGRIGSGLRAEAA